MFEGASPLQNPTPPPHARNTYPYHGEGDKGGEVDWRWGGESSEC